MGLKKLFSKPFTVKKCLIIFILVMLVGLIGVAGRMVYVMLNPTVAFATPVLSSAAPEQPTPELIEAPAATNENDPIKTPEPEPTPDPEAVLLSKADLEFLKDRVNILLVGADENQDRDQTNRMDYRADALMLLTLDLNTKKADLISIPRDSYVAQYNTKGRWKVNSCFAHGGGLEKDGFFYARETISMLLGGIPIPYHIGVQMDGIKKIVDILGGVDYDVDVEIRLNGRVLNKGMQHLDGQQVLDYCRARKGISTDVGRADRQQRILFTIFRQLKSQGRLTQVPELYGAMQEYLHTNLSLEQIAALAVFGLQLDQENDLNRHTLQGEYLTNVYNFSFYALYQQKKCDLVKNIFGITIKPDKTYDASFIKMDWACIQGDNAIQAAQSAVAAAPAWISTGHISSQIDSLSGLIADTRGGGGGQNVEALNAATAALLQSVQELNGAPLIQSPQDYGSAEPPDD